MDNASLATAGANRRRTRAIKALAVVLVLVVLAVGGFAWYVSDYYPASEHGDFGLAESGVSVVDADDGIAVGTADAVADANLVKAGIVLYPGAKVDPWAYVPLAGQLAQRGYLCVIAKPPFNLAFFDVDAAGRIMDGYDGVTSWWVAGHSLGGVAAAQFAAGHEASLEGIVFLASYPAVDLSDSGLRALSVVGSEDGVVNREKLEESASNLPAEGTVFSVIDGGNHAGFGSYGPQDGDGEATIPASEQQRLTAEAIDAFIASA